MCNDKEIFFEIVERTKIGKEVVIDLSNIPSEAYIEFCNVGYEIYKSTADIGILKFEVLGSNIIYSNNGCMFDLNNIRRCLSSEFKIVLSGKSYNEDLYNLSCDGWLLIQGEDQIERRFLGEFIFPRMKKYIAIFSGKLIDPNILKISQILINE